MSLDSKYNKMNNFMTLLDNFKGVKTKTPDTEIKRNKVLKNVITLYNNYCDIYKNDYDNKDELSKAKKKGFITNNLTSLARRITSSNWPNYQNGWNLKMILMKQQNWLTILKLIQIMSKQVLAIKKFLGIWIDR